jgi:hypothetical protein
VDRVNSAAQAAKANKTKAASIEALSYLFALDLRIKEKYNTLLRCLLFYFSRRRETDALKRLQGFFHIEEDADVRNAIEIVLNNLREKLEGEESGDGDDETHGGKRNGKAEEEAVAAEEKREEQASEEKSAEITDAEETKDTSKENTEEISEQTPADEPIKEESAKEQTAETSQEVADTAKQEKAEEAKQEQNNLKEENNGAENKSEPSKNKSEEAKSYNDAVDSPPLYETYKENKPVENKMSFIDEVILDNIAKGNLQEDFNAQDKSEDIKTTDMRETVTREAEEGKSNEKDAFLYDNRVTSEKDATARNTDNTEQAKPEEKQNQTQNTTENTTENTASVKQEKEELRVPLQVDITERMENDMREEICINMTPEAIEAIKQAQTEAVEKLLDIAEAEAIREKMNAQKETMREQLNIDSADLGMDAPAEIVRRPEPVQTNQLSAPYSRR